MQTQHHIVVDDARDLETVPDDSVALVVTSPPYPMIELWDDLFTALDPAIGEQLAAGDGQAAFAAMHDVLDSVWAEIERVLIDGGIACVNVGAATRTLADQFRVYPNHVRITEAFERRGFVSLPEVLWRKPTNAATKFMGSGMLPPNAYVTLEHEHLLVFRNGATPRAFDPGADRRYEAAYFWEERNRWFSDVWTDLPGDRQTLADDHESLRERAAAYPFAVPYRLINMYSVYGDTVLDPFWGTGTTTLAAMIAGRDSIGYERDPAFREAFDERVVTVPDRSCAVIDRRLEAHRAFIEERRTAGETFDYDAVHYDFPVRTAQERRLRLYAVDRIEATDDGYRAVHTPTGAGAPDG